LLNEQVADSRTERERKTKLERENKWEERKEKIYFTAGRENRKKAKRDITRISE
jgi:hypothetical protein